MVVLVPLVAFSACRGGGGGDTDKCFVSEYNRECETLHASVVVKCLS